MSQEDDMDWMVFQRDVLDVLKQYRGYFNFTERIGSLKDSSRPDFVARADREDKKKCGWLTQKARERFLKATRNA